MGKTGAKVVRTDRKAKKMVRSDRKMAGSEKAKAVTSEGILAFVRSLRRMG
jgi:hypothetical protein